MLFAAHALLWLVAFQGPPGLLRQKPSREASATARLALPPGEPDGMEAFVQAADRMSGAPLPWQRGSEADWLELYESAQRRGVLIGFGSVRLAHVSFKVSAGDLEVATGLPMGALVPARRQQIATVARALLLAHAVLVLNFGLASGLAKLIPSATLGVLIDQNVFGSALSLAGARLLDGQLLGRLGTHEAAHFLLAYLHGLPVTGYSLHGRLLSPGSAGAKYASPELLARLGGGELSDGQLAKFATVRAALGSQPRPESAGRRRLSPAHAFASAHTARPLRAQVLMAGAVSEALAYGRTDGGFDDQLRLARLVRAMRPGWDEPRVLGLVRWAALQAVVLLRMYADEHEALVAAMLAGVPLGECVAQIEAGLRRSNAHTSQKHGAVHWPGAPPPGPEEKERAAPTTVDELLAAVGLLPRSGGNSREDRDHQ